MLENVPSAHSKNTVVAVNLNYITRGFQRLHQSIACSNAKTPRKCEKKGRVTYVVSSLFRFLFTSFFLLSGCTFRHDCDLKSTIISDFYIYSFVCTRYLSTSSKICSNMVINNKLTIFLRGKCCLEFFGC